MEKNHFRPPSNTSPLLRDLEIIVKAIILIRESKARNPNDLVLELRILVGDAEKIFDKILENEKSTS